MVFTFLSKLSHFITNLFRVNKAFMFDEIDSFLIQVKYFYILLKAFGIEKHQLNLSINRMHCSLVFVAINSNETYK